MSLETAILASVSREAEQATDRAGGGARGGLGGGGADGRLRVAGGQALHRPAQASDASVRGKSALDRRKAAGVTDGANDDLVELLQLDRRIAAGPRLVRQASAADTGQAVK